MTGWWIAALIGVVAALVLFGVAELWDRRNRSSKEGT